MAGTMIEGERVVAEGAAMRGAVAEALAMGGRDCSIGIHGQIPKIVENSHCIAANVSRNKNPKIVGS